MKKFVKSFLMAAAALMLFAGCSNLGNDATVSGDDGKVVLTIGIDGYNGPSGNVSRTVNPGTITSADFSKITIKGESESYDSFTEKTLEFKSDGTATIELTYDVWYLTLTAYTSDTTPVLQGRRRVDFRNGAPASNAPITFKLSAEGLETAGGVSLSGTFTDEDGLAESYAAALYDLYTNEIIIGTTGTSTLKTGTCTGDDKGKFSYTVSNVKPGRYNFRIYFKNHDGANIGTWGDIVVIAPGRTTTNEDTIALGDILMKKPSAPTALSAYYMNKSVTGNYYNALITWTRAELHNEEYFELTINDVTATTPVTYKIFTNTTDAETKKEIFFESASRVDGTLAAGSEYCIVKLPVGKKFEISIKAANFLGASDSKSRDSASVASTIELANGNAVGANTAYGTEAINLMKIAYDLNGGSLKLSASSGAITGTYNDFVIFKNADITLLTPAATGYPELTNGHHPWQSWKNAAGTAVTKVSEFGNVAVTANYNESSIINYEINDTYGELEDVTITTASGDDVVNSANTITSNGNLIITVNDEGVTHVKVTILYPRGEVSEEDDGNTVTFKKLNAIANGVYEVQVIATIPDANGVDKLYSFVCAITKNK
ncbi:Glycosyl hydrolase family 12 [Treponema bryantii]|uniref:Glycosyl hydrolase family 12 n=1 Tax=Treponema bryantii TaxID=163 RepID=A0A1I3JS16_9SPIR|nr:hypothetical protein [Treponema bryantii]SFI63037.1 Glycosyl hydrolase family 12 [Treponema bryantii]